MKIMDNNIFELFLSGNREQQIEALVLIDFDADKVEVLLSELLSRCMSVNYPIAYANGDECILGGMSLFGSGLSGWYITNCSNKGIRKFGRLSWPLIEGGYIDFDIDDFSMYSTQLSNKIVEYLLGFVLTKKVMYRTGGEGLLESVFIEKKEEGLVFLVNKSLLKAHKQNDGRIIYHDTKEAAKEYLLEQAERELKVSELKVVICEQRIQKIKDL